MTVFVLIREDQNEHGYIDTSITGVFSQARIAQEKETLERLHAQQEGLVVEGRRQSRWRVAGVMEGRGTPRGLSYRFTRFFQRLHNIPHHPTPPCIV